MDFKNYIFRKGSLRKQIASNFYQKYIRNQKKNMYLVLGEAFNRAKTKFLRKESSKYCIEIFEQKKYVLIILVFFVIFLIVLL